TAVTASLRFPRVVTIIDRSAVGTPVTVGADVIQPILPLVRIKVHWGNWNSFIKRAVQQEGSDASESAIQRGADVAVIVVARVVLFNNSEILIVGHVPIVDHWFVVLVKLRTAVGTSMRFPLIVRIGDSTTVAATAAVGVDVAVAVSVGAIRPMCLAGQRVRLSRYVL